MKILLILLITLALMNEILSQPLSGIYTIGGNNPDFVTLQMAADALNARGVSGPVFFNIRPGTYSKNDGNNSVLLLDSTVTGLSEINRITFQPDASSGGNVDNVILELNISNTNTADISLVLISLDYITFRSITFRESETSLYHHNVLVRFQSSFDFNPIVEGVLFENCRFVGSNSNITKKGIDLDVNVKDITIRGNTFIRLAESVVNPYFNFVSLGNLIIEDNNFLAGYYYFGPTGTTIAVSGENLYIRRNILDYNGSATNGFNGILVANHPLTKKVFIEQNLIKGPVSKAIYVSDHVDAQPDSFIIANNMISTYAFQVWPNEYAAGISVFAKGTNIFHNTILIRGGSFNALGVYNRNCRVFNNIIVAKPSYGFNSIYDQVGSLNLQSDYNSIYVTPSGWPNTLIYRDGIFYYDLQSYQIATGLDTNSVSKDIEFVAIDDLHLTGCQARDPEIRGIPIAGTTKDFDNEVRNPIAPMMGADETFVGVNDMFGDPFVYNLPGTAFSIAAGKFDNLSADGIAVPDFDNNQVLLFHYNGNRTFTRSGTLQTLWPPTGTLFYDVDDDGHLDLIVGFYANRLQIFFGDGTGRFPRDTILVTIGHVRSMTVGNHYYVGNNIEQVFLTIDDSNFPPQRSFIGYLDKNSQGRIVVDLLTKPGGDSNPDTIYSVMDDFAMGNIDSNPDHEIVALTVGDFGAFYIFNDTTISGNHYPFGSHYRYRGFNTASYTPSSISLADFDGDGDNDILTTGYDWDELKLIKNQGNFVFTDEVLVARQTRGFVVIDYENDGDEDIVTVNERIEKYGITVYLNDGLGNFIVRENCYFPYADGKPWSIVASDFDLDGKTDIAVTSTSDSLYVLYNLGGGTVIVDDQYNKEIPTSFLLEQNFPNPFNPTSTIRFSIPTSGYVTLKVYNMLGEEVRTLVSENLNAGHYSKQFDAGNLASGVYVYRLHVGNFSIAKKLVVVK